MIEALSVGFKGVGDVVQAAPSDTLGGEQSHELELRPPFVGVWLPAQAVQSSEIVEFMSWQKIDHLA